MINNRQAGRRRGRNNQRPQGGGNRGSGGDSGNRIDSRARGNAAQLLEKYRNLARDAQLAGDRVNAEYYLQFADHYFRVLADNRARQEEQQARYRRNDESDSDGDDSNDDADDNNNDDGDDDGDFQMQQPRRAERRPREPRQGNRREGRDERNQDSQGNRRDERAQDSQGNRRPRVANDDADEGGDDSSMDLAALPPAISRSDDEPSKGAEAKPKVKPESDGDEAPPKPRRGRRPRQQPEAAE